MFDTTFEHGLVDEICTNLESVSVTKVPNV